MSVINLPRDDQGVLRLQEANAARGPMLPVSPIAAGTRVNPHLSPGPYIPVITPEERRSGERRLEQERRGRRRPALLDTRDHHERRTRERRAPTSHQHDRQRPRGINVYI